MFIITLQFGLFAFRLQPASQLRHGGSVRLSAQQLRWLRTGCLSVRQPVCQCHRSHRISDARFGWHRGVLLRHATAPAYTAAR